MISHNNFSFHDQTEGILFNSSQTLVTGWKKCNQGYAMQNRKWILSPRQRCDLEMLGTGAFYPLEGFLTEADYDRVLDECRLANGHLWPIPITLDVTETFAEIVSIGEQVALCDT